MISSSAGVVTCVSLGPSIALKWRNQRLPERLKQVHSIVRFRTDLLPIGMRHEWGRPKRIIAADEGEL
jgi:hypothetical protein